MRRIRYCVAMSLDGYIAGPKGEADWIVMDPDLGKGFPDLFSQFDTFLIGRKTYEAMAGAGGGPGGFEAFKTIVISRTLKTIAKPGVTLLSEHVKETLTALKKQPGKDIWLFGGGELFRSLLDLGVVDSVEVGVIPVLLGGGIPLLPSPAGRSLLTLKTHRVFDKTGTVSLEYAVKRSRARAS
jgi:dihydrofolate reductase